MVDLFLLASLPFGAWRAVMPFVITFLSMDVILARLACLLEREPIVRAWRILPMRLIYRPKLSYCIWKAILRAIKGAVGKLGQTRAHRQRASEDVIAKRVRNFALLVTKFCRVIRLNLSGQRTCFAANIVMLN